MARQRYAEDDALLRDPSKWPARGPYFVCCVKNYDLEPREKYAPPSLNSFGILVSVDGINILSTPGNEGIAVLREHAEPLLYPSLDAMMAAGWEVD